MVGSDSSTQEGRSQISASMGPYIWVLLLGPRILRASASTQADEVISCRQSELSDTAVSDLKQTFVRCVMRH